MAGNVFFKIMPAQRLNGAAVANTTDIDPLGAKQPNCAYVHINYFTLAPCRVYHDSVIINPNDIPA